jgi:cyanophycinase-like exopeptidase
MLNRLLIPLFILCVQGLSAQSYTSYFTGSPLDVITNSMGGVCMMGGATEHDEAMKWFLQRAGGGDILVIRASGSDGYNDYLFTDLGITVNSVETIVFNNSTASNDPYVQQKIMQAEAIWMAGGDQWDYFSYWRNTAVDSLINDGIANRNMVIGGTSAGMAVLGEHYFSAQSGTVTSTMALANPYHTAVTVQSDPFLEVDYMDNVITDTHYDNPDRKGRHVVFLARLLQDDGWRGRGIACDEYTAVCVDENGLARAFGEYPAYDEDIYFLQVNCNPDDVFTPESCVSGTPLDWDWAGAPVIVYNVKGTMAGTHTFDLTDWKTGSGGEWLYWSVDNGTFVETPGAAPNCLLSLNEQNSERTRVFPNPGNSELKLKFTSNDKRKIQVLDINGRLLITESTTGYSCLISTESLDVGTYQVRIHHPKFVDTIEWIKVD